MRVYFIGVTDFLLVAAHARGSHRLSRSQCRVYIAGVYSGVALLFASIALLSYLVSQFASWILPC